MGILITILTVLLVIDCILLIGIILLQRGKGQGLAGAFGVGGMEEALGTHAASTAQKITVVLGALFLGISILLGILYRYDQDGLDTDVAPPPADTKPAAATDSTPEPATDSTPTPAPAAAPAAEPEPAAPAPSTLFAWLTGGQLRGRLRLRRASGPTLLIDAETPAYHGPATLKPLAQYFEGEVAQADLEPLDDAAWAQETAAAGDPQPLARLVWLGALVTGKGRLLPGHDPEARYQLTRWPQTEREFPRHFRIATAMMKGPATLPEIAAASGIAIEEIADFVNASLATGVAEAVAEPPPEPAAPARGGGLLGRLRGR